MSMKTRDMIREAFTKGKKLKSKWSSQTQVNIYTLDIFLQKSGYNLVDIILHNGKVELVVEPIKSGYLHPDIMHDPEENVFYVNVKKYGELNSSDLAGVIEGYQTALGVIKHLEEIDFNKLEIDEE